MTSLISSALASQTASKTAALEILQKLGKRPANLTDAQFKKHHDHTTIEHWWIGIKISIKPFWEIGSHVIQSQFHKGFSSIISWKEFAKRLWERATEKAINLKIQRISQTEFNVEGKQSKNGWWEVTANPTELTCNCWLYKCQFNRLILKQECEPLLKAIASNPAQVKELFNEDTGKLEKSVQITCHHIKAVMLHEFDCENISDYLLDYAEIERNKRILNWTWNWEKLSFNVAKPQPLPPTPKKESKPTPKKESKPTPISKPEQIPEGVELQRTSDWTCLEYRVYVHTRKQRLEYEGEPAWQVKGIGRIMNGGKGGWIAYSCNGNLWKSFDNQIDAIHYLVRINRYKIEEIAEAFHLKNSSINSI